MLARCYLRASTDEQDATRARAQVEAFAADRGLQIAGWYVENESGAKLARPELFRLLADSLPGDVLIVEQVDRLSRLNDADWKRLRSEIDARQIRIVALDLPTSYAMAVSGDEFSHFSDRLLGACPSNANSGFTSQYPVLPKAIQPLYIDAESEKSEYSDRLLGRADAGARPAPSIPRRP